VDASFATHKYSRSHTGCAVAIGGAFVHCRSIVQGGTSSKSSCEAEIRAMSDSAGMILWINQFLEEVGFTDLPPVHIHEDNESSITLFKAGFPKNHASKHYEPRYFFLTSLLEEKLVQSPTYLQHCK